MIVVVNASVTDFLLNAASYLRTVMEGEQVCLTNDGRVQARITPEREYTHAQPVQDKIELARRLKAQLAAKYGHDDWTSRDYLEAGRRA
jgi:antitoxin (DNA-binding transcriptional repressor) of toxin-antitoxin stability system